MYWAQALAEQAADAELAAQFAPVAKQLADNETAIVAELNQAQGVAGDLGGYYAPEETKIAALMRPSALLNSIIDAV